MKTYTDYISGGTLIIRGEHIYFILNNDTNKYKLHIPKSLFCWLIKHRRIDEDKIVSEKELREKEKERERKNSGSAIFS